MDVKGKPRWSIPSHDDYPADAKDQVASAAAGLMGLKILDRSATTRAISRSTASSIPTRRRSRSAHTGVGEEVVMKNSRARTCWPW